jgi:hypothetical protein
MQHLLNGLVAEELEEEVLRSKIPRCRGGIGADNLDVAYAMRLAKLFADVVVAQSLVVLVAAVLCMHTHCAHHDIVQG